MIWMRSRQASSLVYFAAVDFSLSFLVLLFVLTFASPSLLATLAMLSLRVVPVVLWILGCLLWGSGAISSGDSKLFGNLWTNNQPITSADTFECPFIAPQDWIVSPSLFRSIPF